MPSPLTDRRILVMRSRRQASSLAMALEQAGATPILIPTIAIAPPSSYTELDAAIVACSSFDWLVLTSANAVDAFFSRARAIGVTPAVQQVAAIGPATASALVAAHPTMKPTSILLPSKAVAESFAESLVPHIQRLLTERGGAQILLVRAEQARDTLPNALRYAGADLTIATAYRNVIPLESVLNLQALFSRHDQWPDAIPFTSSSSATNLSALLDAAGLKLPSKIFRVSIGPITSQTLRELGMPEHAEAAEPTVPALVQALVEVFSSSE